MGNYKTLSGKFTGVAGTGTSCGPYFHGSYDASATSTRYLTNPALLASLLNTNLGTFVGSQPAGPLVELGDGKCVSVDPESLQAILFTCKPSSVYQQIEYTAAKEPRFNGAYCLTTTLTSGAAAQLAPCNGSDAQKWTFWTGDDLSDTSDYSGLCLATSASTDGALVVTSGCNGGSRQKWTRTVPTSPPFLATPQPAALLKGVSSNKCLLSGASAAGITACDYNDLNQQWAYTSAGELTVAGLCLAGNSTSPALLLCDGSTAQRWTIWPAADGTSFTVESDYSGLCLNFVSGVCVCVCISLV